MRKIIRQPLSETEADKQQNIVIDSIEVTKREHDELKVANVQLLSDITSNARIIKKLIKEESVLLKGIEGNQKIIAQKEKELQDKRQILNSLNLEIKSNVKILENTEKENIKRFKKIKIDADKKINKLEDEIKGITTILEGLTSKAKTLRESIDILQKQKANLYSMIGTETNRLEDIKKEIENKTIELKKTTKQNEKIQQKNVNLVVESEQLTKDKDLIEKQQRKESELLLNLNTEVNKKKEELKTLKETQLLLVKKEEHLHTLASKIKGFYEKAGLDIKI